MRMQRLTTTGKAASLGLIALLVLAAALPGCELERRELGSSWDKFPSDPKPGNNAAGKAPSRGYGVLVARFEGPDRHRQAYAAVRTVRESTDLADLWLADVGGASVIYQGRFKKHDDPQARAAVRTVRELEIDGEKPFAGAKVVAIDQATRAAADPFDLRGHTGAFSLQIAYYDDQFDGDPRKAAEDAVRALREEKVEAYYYHGPYRSLVTIGIFTWADFTMQGTTHIYGPRIKALQEKYPYNLGNGRTIVEKMDGQVIRNQPSFLVRVF